MNIRAYKIKQIDRWPDLARFEWRNTLQKPKVKTRLYSSPPPDWTSLCKFEKIIQISSQAAFHAWLAAAYDNEQL